ncbi:hypothetical protein [Granulicatella balaenopterae]
MKKIFIPMLLIAGVGLSSPTVQAATNEIDKIEYNAKDRSIPQVRGIIHDIFSKLPDFTVGGE